MEPFTVRVLILLAADGQAFDFDTPQAGHRLAALEDLPLDGHGGASSRLLISLTARADSVVPDGILFRTLLVPMDMSVDSQRALALAGTLAENWDATIQLVHVVDPPPVMYYAGNITSRFDLDSDLRGRVEVRLRAAGEGLPVTRCIVAEGHPAVEIARVAYEPEIDLIVMSATGSATIDWLPMGSTTARVCRIARKPVLASR